MADHTVRELERLLKKALRGWRVARSSARTGHAAQVRARVNGLFAARLRAVQRDLTQASLARAPGKQRRHARAQQPYWHREALLREKGIDGILEEFGVPVAVYENAQDLGGWASLLASVDREITAALPAPYWQEPALVLRPRQLAELEAQAPSLRADPQASSILRWLPALASAGAYLQGRLEQALLAGLRHLAAHQGLELARATLLDTVELLRRADAECAMFLHRVECKKRIAQVVWRGGSLTYKSDTGVRLVRLDDGAFGLLARVRDTWLWAEGSSYEVFAAVPDAFFEPAVLAGLASLARAPSDQ